MFIATPGNFFHYFHTIENARCLSCDFNPCQMFRLSRFSARVVPLCWCQCFSMPRRRHDLRNCAVACSTCFCAPDRFLEMPTTGAESSKSHGSHVLILYFLYVRNFAIFLEFAFLNLPLGPSDQVVLRFNAFKFKCVCVKILFLQPWKSYNELFRRCSRYQEPQLLELFASSAMRIAYDCAKKRFRAQFLCVLSRAAEAEARRNDSCVRGSWQKAGLRDLGGDLTDGSVESVELFICLSDYLTI